MCTSRQLKLHSAIMIPNTLKQSETMREARSTSLEIRHERIRTAPMSHIKCASFWDHRGHFHYALNDTFVHHFLVCDNFIEVCLLNELNMKWSFQTTLPAETVHPYHTTYNKFSNPYIQVTSHAWQENASSRHATKIMHVLGSNAFSSLVLA